MLLTGYRRRHHRSQVEAIAIVKLRYCRREAIVPLLRYRRREAMLSLPSHCGR
jgi:hypothetical protein